MSYYALMRVTEEFTELVTSTKVLGASVNGCIPIRKRGDQRGALVSNLSKMHSCTEGILEEFQNVGA